MNWNYSPYVGARPFTEAEASLLFGRETEVNDILFCVIPNQVTLVYSPSGAGKTSLVNAGLIPLFRRRGFNVLPIARLFTPPRMGFQGPQNIFTFNLLAQWADPQDDLSRLAQMSIADFLSAYPRAVDQYNQPAPRVIILDQIEEMFIAFPTQRDQRREFFEQLSDALQADPYLRVVFLIRQEFLADIEAYASLLPGRFQSRYQIEQLRRNAALEAVINPLRITNTSYVAEAAERLVDDLRKITVYSEGKKTEEPGEFVEPVYLQVVCQHLWEQSNAKGSVITLSEVEKLGGVNQALGQFYDKTIGKAVAVSKVSEVRLRRWVEQKLITPAGTRGTVYGGTGETDSIPKAALDELVSRHIIRSDSRFGSLWYELIHDRLIAPILESNAKVLAPESESKDYIDGLKAKAITWTERARPDYMLLQEPDLGRAEKWLATEEASELGYKEEILPFVSTSRARTQTRAKRRAQRLALLFLLLALLTTVLGVYALEARSQAVKNLELSQEARTSLEETAEQLKASQQETEAALDRANDLLIVADEERKNAQESARVAEIAKKKADENARIAEKRRLQAEQAVARETEAQGTALIARLKAEASARDAQAAAFAEEKAKKEAENRKEEAERQAKIANTKTRIADSRKVAADAKNELYEDPKKATGDSLRSIDAFLSIKQSGDYTDASRRQDLRDSLETLSQALPASLLKHTTPIQPNDILSLGFSLGSTQLTTIDRKGTTKVWEAGTGNEVQSFPLSMPPQLIRPDDKNPLVSSVAIGPDGKSLAISRRKNSIELFNILPEQFKGEADGHRRGVGQLAFSDDGRLLASASTFGRFAVMRVDSQSRIWRKPHLFRTVQVRLFDGTFRLATALEFNHETKNRLLAVGFQTGEVSLFQAESGRRFFDLPNSKNGGHADLIFKVSFSPDGNRILTASRDSTAKIWDISPNSGIWKLSNKKPTGMRCDAYPDNLCGELSGHKDAVVDANFSPDGSLIATASQDRSARLWDARSKRPLIELLGHKGFVNAAIFSRDGRLLATTSSDKTAKLWDIPSLQELQSLSGLIERINQAQLALDQYNVALPEEDIQRLRDESCGILSRIWFRQDYEKHLPCPKLPPIR